MFSVSYCNKWINHMSWWEISAEIIVVNLFFSFYSTLIYVILILLKANYPERQYLFTLQVSRSCILPCRELTTYWYQYDIWVSSWHFPSPSKQEPLTQCCFNAGPASQCMGHCSDRSLSWLFHRNSTLVTARLDISIQLERLQKCRVFFPGKR